MKNIDAEKYIPQLKDVAFSTLKGLDLQEVLSIIDNTLIDYRERLGFPDYTTIGVEIEFNNLSYGKANEYIEALRVRGEWQAKSDGTVAGEIVSPILKDTKKTWKELALICNMLKNKGAVANNKAASHIHIGCQTIGGEKRSWINLLKLWMIYEKLIIRFAHGERIGYPKKAVDRLGIPYPTIYEISKDLQERIDELEEYDYDNFAEMMEPIFGEHRTEPINFNNVESCEEGFKNTIEFRCPLGTIEQIIWQNNINFFTNLLLASKSDQLNEDVLQRRLRDFNSAFNDYSLYTEIFLEEALEFVDLIFNEPLDKIYFLKQYLKDFQYGNNPVKRFVR